MPTPTDPYSSAARRPFDEDEILAPISPEAPSSPVSGYSSISAASAEESPRGSDPAFDTNPPASPEEAGPSSLADALAHQSGPEAETPDKPEPEPAPDLFAEPPVVETATPEIPTEPEIPDAPAGRGWTHTGVLIATLLLVPMAWYLLSDASVRLSSVANSPWETGVLNWAAVAEMAGGLAIACLIWLLARRSSLGAQVIGIITAAIGIVPIVAPVFVRDTVLPAIDDAIGGYNDFTANVVDHITYDLASGRILIFGALLLFTGFVAHSARRRGERVGDAAARRSIALSAMAN
ncbi:hypothetical protein [Ancrocorticia populi]|uniref:hypothetical protein n=1 Tax=Ancrocorticia populi TaxID=2175228 RepID=UPI003F973715